MWLREEKLECMNMKNILFLNFLIVCAFGGETRLMELNYEKESPVSYALQIQEGFKKLIDSDPSLATKFHEFEAPPPEGVRGRYSGDPYVQVITIKESESVSFREEGGISNFEKSIALYYRFDEGEHKGKETRSGFFALFDVKGTVFYRRLEADEFEVKESKIVAIFKGFSRVVTAPESVED